MRQHLKRPMAIELVVQNVSVCDDLPSEDQLRKWIERALGKIDKALLTVRLVDSAESQQLNQAYRGKDRPTNVLSFPADLPVEVDLPLLGDIVICAPLVVQEAAEQGKPVSAHWAHLTIHGVLHLLGHDHQDEKEAGEMETLEIRFLSEMGFPNPYQ